MVFSLLLRRSLFIPVTATAVASTAEAAASPPPGPTLSGTSAPETVSPEMLQSLVDMGFPKEYAARALQMAGGDINTALEICMGGDPGVFENNGGAGGKGICRL